ncbi:MAG: hypothetical protein K9I29_05250 [Bacteroidales bacterium]|nr:hypothetical protein [Bacteroidales bacterium]
MNRFPWKTIFWVTIFGVAFAMIETAVVIYLRELYYPEGFGFPLKVSGMEVMGVEMYREFATLLLLVSGAILAGKTGKERFAWFIFAFAIWDIFYYVFLFVFLGWPQSLLTWDVLFLLPFTWVGPVIAPIINSLTMILLAVVIVHFERIKKYVIIRFYHWFLLLAGAVVVIIAYVEDYLEYMLQEFTVGGLLGKANIDEILDFASNYVPDHFKWWIFSIGAGIHLLVIFHLITINYRNKRGGYEQLLGND